MKKQMAPDGGPACIHGRHDQAYCADCMVTELEGELADAVKTLEIYADPFSWRTRSGKVGITFLTDGRDFEMVEGQPTYGKAARACLARLKEGK